jgi:cytochrome c oxidase subunit I+III
VPCRCSRGSPPSGRAAWAGDAPTLFLLGFHFIFVLGGLTGVMVAVLPFDWQVHDSYFVVAHLHYVLIGGMVFPLFAGLYYWAPVINGHRLPERAGRWSCALMFLGFNAAFFPMHVAGLAGMPRRVATYDAGLGWTPWNLLSTLGAFVFAAGALLTLLQLARTALRPQRAHQDPWHAPSLEWLPQEHYGVRSIPQVRSAYPLWDQPGLLREVVEGRHWLPGTAFGARETLVTGPLRGEIRHLLRLAGDGWWHFLAAAATAGFFLLLTVERYLPASACGVFAIAALLAWVWQLDRPPPAPTARIGDGVHVPALATGRAAPSWWATAILVAVDATIFASLAFAHVHVAMKLDVCPPPGARLPGGGAWAAGLLVGSSAAMQWTVRRLSHAKAGRLRLAVAVALACALAAFAIDWSAHREAGLAPTHHAWGATVAALLAWQGLHAFVLLVMGGYVLARSLAGLLRPDARATLDNTALFWHYAVVQGLATIGLVRLLPGWMA